MESIKSKSAIKKFGNFQIFDAQPHRADNLVGLTTWGEVLLPGRSTQGLDNLSEFTKREPHLEAL